MDFARHRPLFAAISIALLSIIPSLALAAEPATPAPELQAPPAPRFDITAFKVEGDTLLGTDKINALVKPFIGASKDFGDVQQALEALQDAYQAKGFTTVRVNLPEQELESGVIHMTVTEQKISSIKVEGNKNYTSESALRVVPSLQVGSIPNTKEIGKSLKIANGNPTKQTAVLFADNEKDENSVDATVKVIDDKPWKASVTLDNTGTRETGHGRLTFAYQNFNMFDTDQRLTAQFITNPHLPQNILDPDHKVRVYVFGYTIPLASIGDSVDLLASYSDSTSTTPIVLRGLIGDISGQGLVLGAHYNHNLDKLPDYEQKLTFAYDNRATKSSHDNQGNLLGTALTTTPLSVTYSGQWTPNPHTIAFSAALSRNIAGIAEHGSKDDFISAQADSTFSKLNFTLDYSRPLPKDWQLHASFSSQISWDSVPAIEKFRIGGMDTVRGFHESELAGDEGFRASVELYTSNIGQFMKSDKTSLRGVFFADTGRVADNQNPSGAVITEQTSITSIGAGLRYNYSTSIVGRFDVAQVINGDTEHGSGTTRNGDHYVNASIAYLW
jgi:hemolysin activation/secretion protein